VFYRPSSSNEYPTLVVSWLTPTGAPIDQQRVFLLAVEISSCFVQRVIYSGDRSDIVASRSVRYRRVSAWRIIVDNLVYVVEIGVGFPAANRSSSLYTSLAFLRRPDSASLLSVFSLCEAPGRKKGSSGRLSSPSTWTFIFFADSTSFASCITWLWEEELP